MLRRLVLFCVALLLASGCAALKPRQETSIGRAVFDVGVDVPSKEIVDKTYDSIAFRADNLQKSVGFVSSNLPDQPGAPDISIRNVGMGLANFSMPQVTCSGAYTVLSGFDKGVSSVGLGTSDRASYTACVYPYKSAYRVYLIGTFISSSGGGVQGLVASGIKQGISGTENVQAKWFKGIVDRFQGHFPEAKKIELDIPQ